MAETAYSDVSDISQKRCDRCKSDFPATPAFFARHVSALDGLQSICKACRYQARNREKTLDPQNYWSRSTPTEKPCTKCKTVLPVIQEFFDRRKGGRDGHAGVCRQCRNDARNLRRKIEPEHASRLSKRLRTYRDSQSDAWRETQRERARNWYGKNSLHVRGNAKRRTQILRQEMLEAYGAWCNCCGESNPIFLTIDHIENDGANHRRTLNPNGGGCAPSMMVDLKRKGWPKDKIQLLCFNCNMGRHRNGGICPHMQKA
jgi:hypothetical protein